MRNVSREPKLAAKEIAGVVTLLKSKTAPDYGDWLFAMMRRGFTKDEAKREFFKRGFMLNKDSTVLLGTKRENRKLSKSTAANAALETQFPILKAVRESNDSLKEDIARMRTDIENAKARSQELNRMFNNQNYGD